MTLSSRTVHPGAESWSTLKSDLASPCRQEPGVKGGGRECCELWHPWVLWFAQNLLKQSQPQPPDSGGTAGMVEGGGTSETCRDRKGTYLREALPGVDPRQVQ